MTTDTAIADARAIFARQQAHRWPMSATTARERRARLRRLQRAIVSRRGDLASALGADFGKHPVESELSEIHVTLEELNFAVAHLPAWMEPRRVPTPVLLSRGDSFVQYEPRGVALILSPWNYPVFLSLGPLVAAVAAGNCVVLRPSEKVPATSAVLRRVVEEAFPPEEVALVEGDIPVAEALLDLPFDHVFFTGSTRVGRVVMAAAARHLASVTLELGGKSPVILDASANVALAAERVMWGKCLNAGQTCVAPDYALVPRPLAPAFVEACRRQVAKMYGGSDAEVQRSGEFCRIIDVAAVRRVAGLLRDAVSAGATIAVGGTIDEGDRFIAPTIVTGVTPDTPLMREEIFGPVLPVVAYDTLDEALAIVRAHGKPLALYLFSRNRRVTRRVLQNTTAGGTCINGVIVQLATPWLPYGGVGESGTGSYHGEAGFRAFSHERAVLRQGSLALVRTLRPPYTRWINRLARAIVRRFE